MLIELAKPGLKPGGLIPILNILTALMNVCALKRLLFEIVLFLLKQGCYDFSTLSHQHNTLCNFIGSLSDTTGKTHKFMREKP